MSTEYRGFEQCDDYLRSVIEIMLHVDLLYFANLTYSFIRQKK